jgi:hypothetical protein
VKRSLKSESLAEAKKQKIASSYQFLEVKYSSLDNEK